MLSFSPRFKTLHVARLLVVHYGRFLVLAQGREKVGDVTYLHARLEVIGQMAHGGRPRRQEFKELGVAQSLADKQGNLDNDREKQMKSIIA